MVRSKTLRDENPLIGNDSGKGDIEVSGDAELGDKEIDNYFKPTFTYRPQTKDNNPLGGYAEPT